MLDLLGLFNILIGEDSSSTLKKMDRRSFVGVLGGLGVAAAAPAAPEKRTQFFTLDSYKLKAGSQLPTLQDYFSKTVLPKANKLWDGPKIYLEALIAPHMPQILAIYGFASLEEMASVMGKMSEDAAPEASFETLDSTLLRAAPYATEIKLAPAEKPRVFELRVYHSPTYRQLAALHERFAGPEIKIFHRSGIHPILYSSTLIGPDTPNLTYLIPFDSLADREKAWAAFSADPEWVKVRKESIDRNGQISSVQNISLWKAAEYSPIR